MKPAERIIDMPNKPPRRMKNPPPKISLREVEQAIRGSISNKDMHQYGSVKDSVNFIAETYYFSEIQPGF